MHRHHVDDAAHRHRVDPRHRRTAKTWPSTVADTVTAEWKYDPDKHRIEQTTANGRTLGYSVDALGRITAESVASPIPGEIASVAFRSKVTH